jgi:ornithine cyclodeaminase
MGLGNTARATALCLIDDAKGQEVKFRLLRYKDQAELFIERFKDATNATFEIIDTMEEFVSGASVIISCITNAHGSIFCEDESKFQKGVLIVPVHSRGFQNCDLFFDKVFADDTGHISGFKYFPKFRRYDEFSRVLLGENPGRENDEERILNYNAGLGIHDALFASKLYDLMSHTDGDGFYQHRANEKFWV